jgi:hypothetical protein
VSNQTPEAVDLTCDHCGKRPDEVKKPFAGTRDGEGGGKICDECVFLCLEIMAHEDRGWFQEQLEAALSRSKTFTGDR